MDREGSSSAGSRTFTPIGVPAAGTAWLKIVGGKPGPPNIELFCPELSTALQRKTEFTPQEWYNFERLLFPLTQEDIRRSQQGLDLNRPSLCMHHCIKSGDDYYEPARNWSIWNDGFLPQGWIDKTWTFPKDWDPQGLKKDNLQQDK